MKKTIRLKGEGGQGIKLMGIILGNVLTENGFNVSLNFAFDTAVRGGMIEGDLIYSDERIDNPIIGVPGVLVQLGGAKMVSGSYKILDEGVGDIGVVGNDYKILDEGFVGEGDSVPFYSLAVDKFGNRVFTNMIALGYLLKHLGIDISGFDLKKVLPERFVEENIKAISFGFNLKTNK